MNSTPLREELKKKFEHMMKVTKMMKIVLMKITKMKN